MTNNSFELKGAKEFVEAMKDLSKKIQIQIIGAVLRKAGNKFVVSKLKSILPTKKSVIKVVSDSDSKLAVQAGVTRSGYKLRWTDLGTDIRTTKKGWNRGQIIGKHQIQPAIESQIEPTVEFLSEELGNEIDKFLKRKLKRLRSK